MAGRVAGMRLGRPIVAIGVATAVVVAAGSVAAWRTLSAPAVPAIPRFVDETTASGLDHTYGGDDTFDVGGGVAVFDCDADGLPDVYAAGGGDPAALFRNVSTTGGALRFTRIASDVTDLGDVTGAYPLDVDGDGVTDLVVLREGESVALRGLGGCRFEPANEAWHLAPTPAFSTAFSATWEAASTLPTLAFGNYLDPQSPPGTYVCSDDELVRPAATGTSYAEPVPLRPGFCSLSMLFSDWDGSGRRDLRVSNDRQYYDDAVGGEQLWRMTPAGPPRLYGPADGWRSLEIWGMGIASQDLTGDGLPEVYLTSQGDNKLQTLAAGPSHPAFRDIALAHGVTAAQPYAGGQSLPSTAWHPEFVDVNDDGLADLFVS